MPTVKSERATSSSKKPAAKKASSGYAASGIANDFIDNRGFGLLIYGLEGVGKSLTACHAERPIVIPHPQDHGVHKLRRSGLLPKDVVIGSDPEDWQHTLDILDELAEGYGEDHDRKTVIMDYIGGVQSMCFDHCCEVDYGNDWSAKGFLSFQQGPGTAGKHHWPEVVRRWTSLQSVGMNVILIGHAKTETYKNPEGEDYDRFVVDLHDFNSSGGIKGESIRKATYRWADSVIFLRHSIDVVTEDRKRAKAQGGDARIMCTQWSATYDAKNREKELSPVLGPYYSAEEAWDGYWKAIHPKAPVASKKPVRK